MLLLFGEVVVDTGKVLELKARRPLSLPATLLIQGWGAEGCRVANSGEREGGCRRADENDDEGQAKRIGGKRPALMSYRARAHIPIHLERVRFADGEGRILLQT